MVLELVRLQVLRSWARARITPAFCFGVYVHSSSIKLGLRTRDSNRISLPTTISSSSLYDHDNNTESQGISTLRTRSSPDLDRVFLQSPDLEEGRDKSPPMTAVHSRAPLEVLSMSAAQRPQARRKTARQFLDEDEEPPAKRSKVESVPTSNGVTKATSSKGVASRPKKAKKCMCNWH